jgi:glyoxylase-like metal-dependent hydrolase (beta-lactamase superfamily II)
MKTIHAILITALASISTVACSSSDEPQPVPDVPAYEPTVHTYSAPAAGIFANAYLVETENGVVAVDATLTVSDARALRAQADAIGKPLLAVLLTHGHPDHYNGVTDLLNGEDVPVLSTSGVDQVIRADDAAKEVQWKPVFAAEWPETRTFPSRIVEDGETVTFDGVSLTVHDLGPGESHFDSYWILETGKKAAFIGDVAFHDVHSYMSDGHSGAWLSHLDELQDGLGGVEIIYPGHGAPGDTALFDQEREYIQLYRQTVGELAAGEATLTEAAKMELMTTMKSHLPTDKLEFLIQLGADPVANELLEE